MTTWRLLRSQGGPGAWHMAVDVAIMEARRARVVPPTLRLYEFDPRCATIGRFQDTQDIDVEWCSAHGVDIARRPTGGRGVLHADEITYAVIACVDDGVPQGVTASYRHLCSALVAGYASLGVTAQLTGRDRGGTGSGACYLHATRADVSSGASKLAGSAQVWRGDTVLQHGSFVLSREPADEAGAFRLSAGERARLRSTTVTLSDLLGHRPERAVVEQAVCDGFADALAISFEEGVLSESERERAASLEASFSLSR